MDTRRGPIFLILALAMGVAAAWFTQRMVSKPAPEQVAAPRTTPVVVVRADVAVATSLTNDQLTTTEWPADHVPHAALTRIEQAVGRVVRRPLAEGEPVLTTALFETGAPGGLPAVIEHGERAVTVKVDNVIGVAGFVTPGARVDVLATMRRVDREKAIPYSRVILQNVRALAVDQKLEEAKPGEPEVVSVVTLEVTPVQAEHLIYAAHEGRLQLAMRSPGDVEEIKSHSVSVADLLGDEGTKSAVRPAAARAGGAIEIIDGNQLRTTRFN
jgi:pilus assembly protein CpaB